VDGTSPVCLFAHRAPTRRRNRQKLALLVGETGVTPRTYQPLFRHKIKGGGPPTAQQRQQLLKLQSDREALEKKCLLCTVEVAVGAQVMMKRNTFAVEGVVNGSLGHVTAFTDNTITVRFTGGQVLDVVREKYELWVNPVCCLVMIQFPLVLAWAQTIHSAQGLTLEYGYVDPHVFGEAMVYVALSRFPRLNSFYLQRPLLPSKVKVWPQALAFESQEPVRDLRGERERPRTGGACLDGSDLRYAAAATDDPPDQQTAHQKADELSPPAAKRHKAEAVTGT